MIRKVEFDFLDATPLVHQTSTTTRLSKTTARASSQSAAAHIPKILFSAVE
jgi:hypothetical protein